MAQGVIADQNLALTAVMSGGAWVAAQPVTNLNKPGYKSDPARCVDIGNLAASQFTATLETARPVNLVGIMFHTLSSNASWRIVLAGLDGNLGAPVYQSAWTPVVGRLWDSSVLEWEVSNWWTGQPEEDELALYPRHLWIPIPLDPGPICGALRVEFQDPTNEAGYFDIGGVWIARTWSPLMNFDRGRDFGSDSRAVVEEAPSGRMFGEDREPRRRLTVTWSYLQKAEAIRLHDAGRRADTTREVLFVPDLEDAVGMIREAWPATFEKPPAIKFTYDGLHTVAATFKEVIA
jgi:hypothetical protein